MKIIAFLQNPYFKPGTQLRHIEMYKNSQAFHQKVLLNSATGKRLEEALGKKLFRQIQWDNANPKHGETRSHVEPPNFVHMARAIAQHQAEVVLLFGVQAYKGWDMILQTKDLEGLQFTRKVIAAPHPMSYDVDMKKVARAIRKVVCTK